jgi:predicted kinase
MEKTENRPQLIMMVGLIGAGKTHWVRQHVEKTPDKHWVIVSTNDLLEEYCRACNIDYIEAFDRFMNKCQMEMKQRLVNALQLGFNVIWDQTNTIKNARMRKLYEYRTLLNRHNYHKTAVVVHPSPDVWAKRLEMGGRNIPVEIVATAVAGFSLPADDEGFDDILVITD